MVYSLPQLNGEVNLPKGTRKKVKKKPATGPCKTDAPLA
jgi:hypothetical protein